MKCDELETEQWLDYGGEPMPCYPAKDVDEAIDELKAENERLKGELSSLQNKACEDVFEGISPSHIECPSLRFAKEKLCATKRALWLARAKKAEIWERYWEIKISLLSHTCMYASEALFALEGYEQFPDTIFLHHTYRLADEWELVWKKVKKLCIKKMEEYK